MKLERERSMTVKRDYENAYEFEVADGTVKIRADVDANGLRRLLDILPKIAVLVEGEKDNPAPPVAPGGETG